ncbi:DUF2087 domain-containing protein [Kocuria indica]|uniref:DUF2087 domain-containing protein n=1 Tax=Kocuria marina TaxID=223184 RepID=UPI001EF579C3|nr:DUF2087 domain-containing protein [Kocuria indica]
MLSSTQQGADDPLIVGLIKIGFAEIGNSEVRFRETFLSESLRAIDGHLGAHEILLGNKIDVNELQREKIDSTVAAVIRRVIDADERVSEFILNERLRMFVLDIAFFRRHAVDTGVLGRTQDGAMYWLAAS